MKPSILYLRECVWYNAERGVVWLERPRSHFGSDRIWRIWNTKYADTVAGTLTVFGYRYIIIKNVGQKAWKIAEHHIIWALATGNWPVDEIDHINGIRNDNRLVNLREATHAENAQNREHIPRPYLNGKNRWAMRIHKDGKCIRLGNFDTPEAAREAYLVAKRKLHLFQSEPRTATGP